MAERTAFDAAMEEFKDEGGVGGNVRGTVVAQVGAQCGVEFGELVPWNTGVKVVFEMIILVAHKETDERDGKDRAGSPDFIVGMFQKRVLAHSADVDHGVNKEHRDEPSVQEPNSGQEVEERSSGQNGEQQLSDDTEPIARVPMLKSENGNCRDVDGITHKEPEPIHDEYHPSPACVVRVMVRITVLTQVAVVPQVEDTISRTILQHWNGAESATEAVQECIAGKRAVNGFMCEQANSMQRGASEQVTWKNSQPAPWCFALRDQKQSAGSSEKVEEEEDGDAQRMPPVLHLMQCLHQRRLQGRWSDGVHCSARRSV